MKKYVRVLDIEKKIQQKSYFLFGPRQTGKTWLIKNFVNFPHVFINLLKSETYLNLKSHPQRLREIIDQAPDIKYVIIDEIQRVPELLNEVHYLIEDKKINFLLTGSSARSLRKKGVNLLGGRARRAYLFPLVSKELGSDFNLLKALSCGTIPIHYQNTLGSNLEEDLSSYIENYLTEEIVQEALVRNLPAFSRFLEVAALSNAEVINYSKIANDAQVAPSTVQEYYQILRDTLIGTDLPVWREGVKRKVSKTSKFYFFDSGVVRKIIKAPYPTWQSANIGNLLETFIHNELKAFTSYYNKQPLCHWRTSAGHEVDFILDNKIAIEVKATTNPSKSDLKSLKMLREEKAHERYILLCRQEFKTKVDDIEIWPIEEFLKNLWQQRVL